MFVENKDLENAFATGHPLFSCLQALRYSSLQSQNQYIELLKIIRSLIDKDEVKFSWQGIKKQSAKSKLSTSHIAHTLNDLSNHLSSQTLEWLDLKSSDKTKLISNLPDWESFRLLIHYLIECVQQEAGAVTAHYDDAEGEHFLYLPQHGDWMPRTGKLFTGLIPHKTRSASFLNRLASNDPSIPLVLGYPVETWVLPQTHENIPPSAIVSPVFQFKMSYDVRQNCFFNIDPIPEVNFAWLNKRLKNKEQKKAFLRSCGFMDVNADTESLAGDISQTLWHLTSILSRILPADYIREPLLSGSVPDNSLKDMKSGIYNRSVLMIGKRGRYVKTLISELTYIAERPEEELEQTALGSLFFLNQVKDIDSINQFDHASTVLDTLPLNAEQRQAVSSLQRSDISVITGPPGTGKSQVAAAVMADMRLRAQSVLFASKNHKAIDAVMGRLKVEDGSPYVIRANDKNDPNLKITFRTIIRLLLEGSPNQEANEKCHALLEKAEDILKLRGIQASIAQEIESMKNQMGELEESIAFNSLHLTDKFCSSLNKSPEKFPNKWIPKIEQILETLQTKSWLKKRGAYLQLFLLRLKKNLLIRLPGMPKLTCPSKGGITVLKSDLSTLQRAGLYVTALHKVKEIAGRLHLLPEVENISRDISELSEKLEKLVKQALPLDLIVRGSGLPPGEERERIANLRAALRAIDNEMMDYNVEQSILDQAQQDIALLLSHFPCWAVTNLSVGSRLPLVAGMYDLTIIDEASQCDMASAIPVLYRARRAGVIGDPYQLRHISNIGIGQDALIRQRVNFSEYSLQRFSYMNTSLYDLFAEAKGVRPVFLSETYRSHADIAEYSNESFYDNRLRVAIDPKQLNVPKGRRPGLHWTHIESEILSGGPNGCHCPEECEEIIDHILQLLKTGFRGTIGVVTPFRQQANRINDTLYEQNIPQDIIQETRLYVDTSHGFQGDERDVMLFSLCSGPEMPKGSLHFLEKQGNLFNVAASRARAILHVVGNREWAQSCGIKHIERLAVLRSHSEKQKAQGPWAPHDSPWEKVLYKALINEGLEPISQYPVAGRRLDFALVRTGDKPLKLDIEVDGDQYHRNPDGSRKQEDIWRDHQLKSLGWQIKRFWVYQLREDLNKCVNVILKIWRNADDNL